MKKQRGYPDRQGMGSVSDSVSEQFVPSARYRAQQLEMAEALIAGGFTPEQVVAMFAVRIDLPSAEKSKDR